MSKLKRVTFLWDSNCHTITHTLALYHHYHHHCHHHGQWVPRTIFSTSPPTSQDAQPKHWHLKEIILIEMIITSCWICSQNSKILFASICTITSCSTGTPKPAFLSTCKSKDPISYGYPSIKLCGVGSLTQVKLEPWFRPVENTPYEFDKFKF